MSEIEKTEELTMDPPSLEATASVTEPSEVEEAPRSAEAMGSVDLDEGEGDDTDAEPDDDGA